MNEILVGSCLCGKIKYQINLPFLQFIHCHCSRCRKATGTAHATNLYVNRSQFTWITEVNNLTRYDLSKAKRFATVFCKTCGSPLPRHTRNHNYIAIPAGSLDSSFTEKPTARLFWDSRAIWDNCEEHLLKFSERPEKWP